MSRVNVGKVAPVPKGTWSSTSTYEKLNMVNKSGILYIAKKNVPANTNINDDTYWMKASRNLSDVTVTSVSHHEEARGFVSDGSDGQILNLIIPHGVPGNESIDDSKTIDAYDYVWSATKTYNEIKAGAIILTASGSTAVIAIGAPVSVADMTVGIEPIQAGTGDPSPENICPISGWTGCNVTRTGKNLIHCETLQNDRGINVTENTDGSITLAGTMSSSAGYSNIMTSQSQPLKKGTYTLSISKPLSYNLNFHFIYSNETNDYSNFAITANKTKVTFTTDRDGIKWRLHISQLTQGQTIDDTFFIQLESGTEATTYEYPNINEYLIPFTEAGTVYGGNLNATTGKLTVNKEIVDLGTLSWSLNTSGSNPYFRATLASTKRYTINTQTGCFSDRYKLIAAINGSAFASNANNNECTILSNSAILAIRNDSYTSESDFTTAMNGSQFVYELAEPVTYQLTPTEVTTLLGQNNIWANTGDIEVVYKADIKLYIDQKIAESQRATRSLLAGIETDMVATKDYSVGDLLIVGDTLYKATANIASGGTITVGTNVAATTVAEQLILLAQA